MPRKVISITAEQIRVAYVDEQKSMKDIALEFECSAQTICNLLRYYGIPARSSRQHSERTRAKMSAQSSGEKHRYYGKKRPNHSKALRGRKRGPISEATRQRMSSAAKGRRLTKETKQKISLANKGKIITAETRKKLARASTGRRHNTETRKKMSAAKNGLWGGKYAGEFHPNWKPPSQRKTPLHRRIRSSSKMQDWRKSVFERDNWTCQSCQVRGGILNADHIEPFAKICAENKITSLEEAMVCEKLWDLQNGRTLCLNCHKKTDTFAKHIERKAND